MIAGEALPRISDWAAGRGLDYRHDCRSGYGAVFSPCGTWRYLLWRAPTARAKFVGMGMLNPSEADETRDDPTIRQCRARARQAGFAGLLVWNLFAFRTPFPRNLKLTLDPVGPENDAAIVLALALSSRTILAWGNHGAVTGRDRAVLAMLAAPPYVLGLTDRGQPRHPLYLPRGTRLRRWPIAKSNPGLPSSR